ncbi:hypothetical protein [Paenibacillus alginolyticus]|uniref:Uncharacterized protein n=1 Tax=Paenibacillus alginolyticus TaxID=59839 RepID=A0ABT4G6K9_9BACL|nr:hypothetical protein [Paenibacillus alginolyticus]MCY9691816.1 hypothetical protein [Paenibacillus alginolyticus]MEC0143220.1 hypothetical protein [Paenibacillus alginolyticus]
MEYPLLLEMKQLITELEQKEAETIYTIPHEIMGATKKAKNLERFLHDIFAVVNGSGGINLLSIIRREFGMSVELIDHMDQWAPYSKDQFEDALHDAIDRAEIRTGKQGLFFQGSPDRKEAAEALHLLKSIAHAAVKCQFHPKLAGTHTYIEILDHVIQFYALPNSFPDNSMIKYRNLLSSDRLYALSGNDDTITAALKSHVKEWYQLSSFTFLENSEWYHTYESVLEYLYVITEEQLERLRIDYIQQIRDEFIIVKAKPDLHRVKHLTSMLETVLNWKV